MILRALNDYYLRRQSVENPVDRLPAYGLEKKEIPFLIEINCEGRLLDLVDTRTLDGKKKVGQCFLVPQGIKKTSGVAPNLLWDTAEYVLGINNKGKPARAAEKHAAFCARIQALPELTQQDAGIRAVRAFFENAPLQQCASFQVWEEILASNPVLSFRLNKDPELVCQRPAVVSAGIAVSGDVHADGVCLVTGAPAVLERLHPSIKNVWGAQTSGANIVSFNHAAFNSYGKEQGANAPIGKPAAFAYTTALNDLLAQGSKQRLQVGDASTVFWAEEKHVLESLILDLFGEPSKDNPARGTEALKILGKAVETGDFAGGTGKTCFHILGLAPNAARIAIRFWKTATAQEIAHRIHAHFKDLEIVRSPGAPIHLSLFRMLTAVAVRADAANIPPDLGGEIMRSVLEGGPYPALLLSLAVQQCRADKNPTYARAAIIKAVLNRSSRCANIAATYPDEEFKIMLDPTNSNPAYRLGRLFAILEKIQEEASPNVTIKIGDRFYNAASSMPVGVFPVLLRLKNHHLSKLSRERVIHMERLVGDILSGFDEIPRNLPLQDQGRFALGYYHQRQAFFAKQDIANQTEGSL